MEVTTASERRSATHRKSKARPKAKARRKELDARPEAKARLAARNASPAVKARKAEHARRPESKAQREQYRSTPEYRVHRAARRALPYEREKANAYYETRRTTGLQFRLAKTLRGRLHMAIKGKSKRGSAVALLGCTIDELIAQFESQFAVGMSWADRGAWHIDHIRPLSSFDLQDPVQLAVACHHSNLQPLWASDNMSKGGKVSA